jgi:hypothetical protein
VPVQLLARVLVLLAQAPVLLPALARVLPRPATAPHRDPRAQAAAPPERAGRDTSAPRSR